MRISRTGFSLCRNDGERQRGGALLAVMWLSAALAAIAFSVASSVHGETERTSTSVDDVRSYYLATGALERAIIHIQWGMPFYSIGQPVLNYQFPTGDVAVEIIPETAKLNVNMMSGEQLYRLMLTLGQDEPHASEVAQSIIDWRTPRIEGTGPLDGFYQSVTPSFRPRHASIQEIEELLSVKGMTPDLYYGTYVRDTSATPPQLVARGGLRDCVSVYGTMQSVDVNGAAPAVLAYEGLSPEAVQAVVARRPFHNTTEYMDFTQANPMFARVRLGGNSMFTLRATARLRLPNGNLSDLRRKVSETVRFVPDGSQNYVVMRWYDRG
jgi:general secretion pathway protein K